MPARKPLVYDNEMYAMSRGFKVNEFGKLLEAAMVRESKDNKKERFSPSGLGYAGSCARKWYYAFNGAWFDYSNTRPEAMANMNAGSDAGVRIAGVLEKAGILVEAERLLDTTQDPNYPPIVGYIDAIVNWQGEEVVCEVKTTKDATWQRRVSMNTVPGYQLVQLLIYMRITGIDKGFFLTENKDSHKIFILPIKMTESYAKLINNVFEWMRLVYDNAVIDQKLPTRSFERTSMECKGCEFRDACWSGVVKETTKREYSDSNPGEIFIPKLDIPK